MPKTGKNDPIATEVQTAVSEFVARIEGIAREAAEEKFNAVMQSLGAAPTRTAAKKSPARGTAKPAPKKRGRVPMATVQKAVLEALSGATSPMGMRGLRKATGYPAEKIRRAISDLLAKKAVSKKGQKAATVYWLGKGAAKAPAKPKAPKKPAKKKTAKKKAPKKPAKKKTTKKKAPKKTAKK